MSLPSAFTSVTVAGVPLFGGAPTNLPVRTPITGSLVLFVGPNAAAVPGIPTQNAYATLGGSGGAFAALGNRQNLGDIIYVLPGHTESITGADFFSLTGTASGFSVIGLGEGNQRGTLSWTAAASTWLLDTAGVEVANLILTLAVTAATVVVTPITVSAGDCAIIGCQINWGASTTIGCGSTLGAIALTTAADRFRFILNYCVNLDVAGTAGQAICLLSCNGADNLVVSNNRIFGATTATTVGPLHFLTTLSSNIEISYNYIENLITSSTIAISSAISGVTGFIDNNYLRVNSGIQPITVSANISCTLYQNFCSNAANKQGAAVLGAGVSA